jgi:transposase-like protein
VVVKASILTDSLNDPDEDSAFKLLYLAIDNIAKRWIRPIKNWRAALSHFAILFPERFKI